MFGPISLFCFLQNFKPENRLSVLFSANPNIYNIDITEMHPKTTETALKHCETYRTYAEKSICAAHTTEAFKEASRFVDLFYQLRRENGSSEGKKYVILDSGCGAGMSTVCLSSLYPDIPVIGIDRSVARLSRNKKLGLKIGLDARSDNDGNNQQASTNQFDTDLNAGTVDDTILVEQQSSSSRVRLDNDQSISEEYTLAGDDEELGGEDEGEISLHLKSNAILVRAELSDFFTLVAFQSDWIIHSHYLLYPNPYPKGKHLKRRWHGHPIFPVMLALGGTFVVRSNWRVYCEEMAAAVDCLSQSSYLKGIGKDSSFRTFPEKSGEHTEKVTTHFERKYIEVGLEVFEFSANLGERSREQRLALLLGSSSEGSQERSATFSDVTGGNEKR